MAIGSASGTYTMRGQKGDVVVKGEGVDLAALLRDCGIEDPNQVASITFKSAVGGSATVTWADITGAQAPMLATRSYVLSEGGQTAAAAAGGQTAGGAAAAPELLDNTRFRLLAGGLGSADPDTLRYINEIEVKVKPGKGGDITDSELEVHVDYVPVPYGDMAVLSAVPNQAVGGARFGFRWQRSDDDGASWADVEGGLVQTLRVKTVEGNIGAQYRVILETDMKKAEQAEEEDADYRGTTSAPVTIEEGGGFTVVLAYDPPAAGSVALFQSSVKAIIDGESLKIDPSKITYVWEQSSDGGATWSVIPNATGPSFSVQTEPVAQSTSADSGSSGEAAEAPPVTLIYVRVTARTTDERIPANGRVAISNMQPLTVRVGGDGEDPNAKGDGGEKSDTSQEAKDPDPQITDSDKSGASASSAASAPSDASASAESPASDESESPESADPSESSAAADKSDDSSTVPEDTDDGGDNAANLPNMHEVNNITVENTPVSPRSTQSSGASTPTSPENATASQAAEPEQQPAQQPPANAKEITPDQLVINPEATALVRDQQQTVEKALEESRPGARWTKITTIEPTPDDVRNILSSNPFAPFALPLALGIFAAGGVEKAIAFRREKR